LRECQNEQTTLRPATAGLPGRRRFIDDDALAGAAAPAAPPGGLAVGNAEDLPAPRRSAKKALG
jgi:hypothetical protein